MNELTRVDRWLHSVLSGDATLAAAATGGMYSEVIPRGTAGPAVVWSLYAPHDVATANGSRVMVSDLWAVRGSAATSSWQGPLATIADRIDEVLHRASGQVVADGRALTAVRDRTFRTPPEVIDGVEYRQQGGIYRVFFQIP